MLRVLHTADWHLGQRLHEQSREYEHRQFLEWLLEQLEEHAVDVLLVAGDLFDSANPPVGAQRLFYEFVTRARASLPALQMIFLGGNHDSPARLESARPLLEMIGVHAIGAVTLERRRLDAGRLLIPLKNRQGKCEVLCAAMPYLRPVDLPRMEVEGLDPLIEGVRQRYLELIGAARGKKNGNQALLVTGHCYLVRGKVSESSERRILGGNQHALPLDIFPSDIDYVALGHLHLAQALEERVRYSGSPLPLSLAEADYPHQVLLVDFEAGRLAGVEALRVPRAVEILRLPESGPGTPEQVAQRLRAFEGDPGLPPERHPWLEVRVRLEQPEPGLWERLSTLVENKPVRFLKLTTERSGDPGALEEAEEPLPAIDEILPEEVFRQRCRQAYGSDPEPELLASFHELVQQVQEAAE